MDHVTDVKRHDVPVRDQAPHAPTEPRVVASVVARSQDLGPRVQHTGPDGERDRDDVDPRLRERAPADEARLARARAV